MAPLDRHIAACNNIVSSDGLLPFRIGAVQVGWLAPVMAAALTALPGFAAEAGAVRLAEGAGPEAPTAQLDAAARRLASAGLLRIRGEAFDVRATPDGPVLATLDRGAVPAFGVLAQGVHLNGLVRRPEGLHLWVGFRSRSKAVAPGQLDHLVAGGIPAGLTPAQTLLKEAVEEASLPPALALQARPVGRITYTMRNAEGLRRDVLHAFDLDLPESFRPHPNDDEVERFELWPVSRVLAAVRETEDVKFNVNLVLIDLFLRLGVIPAGGTEALRLRAALERGRLL